MEIEVFYRILFCLMSKISEKENINLSQTKTTSVLGNRNGGELSDITRMYRREEILKKKLKNVLEINANL
jgi:hypothetical protein